MTLDNETQRQMLISIVSNFPMQGNLQSISTFQKELINLLTVIQTAKIGEKKDGVTK